MSQSSHLSRYKPAVIAITSVAAAACIYALYSTYSDLPLKKAPLRRSNAVRRPTPQRPSHVFEITGYADPRSDAPLGFVEFSVDGERYRVDVAEEGVPTDEEFLRACGVPVTTGFRTELKIAVIFCLYRACLLSRTEEQRSRLREVNTDLEHLAVVLSTDELPSLRRIGPDTARIVLLVSGEDARLALADFLASDDFVEFAQPRAESDQTYADTEDARSFTASNNEPSQGLKGLLYHIAETDARRKAYEHRGIHCNACHEQPIRGVRWRCLNCADYDLCATCETNVEHAPNHIFAKVKIPLPTISQVRYPQRSWYPGYMDGSHYPTLLRTSVKKRLEEEYDWEPPKLDALYDQFTTLCDVPFADDPAHVDRAIDRTAFNRALTSERWRPRYRPNALYDRMFAFYDTDRNGLIGFEEFLSGMAYLRGRKRFSSLKRALEGFDIDEDGYFERRDFMRLFRANHDIQKLLVNDMMQAQEEERTMSAVEDLRSSQPISAMFRDEDIPQGSVRSNTGKFVDAYGDVQPLPGTKTILEDNEGWPVEDRRRRVHIARQPPHERLQGHFSRFEEMLSSSDVADAQQDGADVGRVVFADQSSTTDHQQTLSPSENTTSSGSGAVEDEDAPLDQDVLWQLVEEGFHEILDPLFQAKEEADEMVVKSREDRGKWKREIEQAAQEIERTKTELQNGAEVDPLMATAMDAFNLSSRSTALESPQDYATPSEALKSAMVPTDAESLAKREEEIWRRPLDELLSTSGYGVLDGGGFPDGEDLVNGNAARGASNGDESSDNTLPHLNSPEATNGHPHPPNLEPPAFSAASSGHSSTDPTMPQNRPNHDVLGDYDPGQKEATPVSTRSTDALQKPVEPPSRAHLALLVQHDQLDEAITARGGPGRLSLAEVEELANNDGSRELKGLITSWLELASF